MTQDREAAREARIAAVKAARSQQPRFGPETRIPVSEVQAGDFLVVVPSQRGVRGTRFQSTVAETVTVHAGERIQRGGHTLFAQATGVAFGTARDGGIQWGSQVWPLTFEAVVRRVV